MFNDLTGLLFKHHKLPIEEMFDALREMLLVKTAKIVSDLKRNPKQSGTSCTKSRTYVANSMRLRSVPSAKPTKSTWQLARKGTRTKMA